MRKASDSVLAYKNLLLDSALSITQWRRPNFYMFNYTNHYSFAFNLTQRLFCMPCTAEGRLD
jgi:hypothetical protein